jgi:hypothetical protein
MTFDGVNRLVIMDTGETDITAKAMYSAWKDWVASGNGGYFPAFRTIGGDPLGGGLLAGDYYFLQTQDGWRIRPYEGNHTLVIFGNLFPDSADTLFVNTLGVFRVQIQQKLSSLTQTVETGGGSGGGLTSGQDAKLSAIKISTDRIPMSPATQEAVIDAKKSADNAVASNFIKKGVIT